MAIKQVIVIRKDLKMRRGKEIAQGSHAAMAFLIDRLNHGGYSNPGLDYIQDQWLDQGQTKICVQVNSEQELLDVYRAALNAKLTAHIIRDAGRTEFNGVPTYTALAIGPNDEEEVDKVTKELKLY